MDGAERQRDGLPGIEVDPAGRTDPPPQSPRLAERISLQPSRPHLCSGGPTARKGSYPADPGRGGPDSLDRRGNSRHRVETAEDQR
jgi:hypothetical protein